MTFLNGIGIPTGAFDTTPDSGSRNLAGEELIVDYTILSMAIVAMSLLMIVEIVRHKIDQIAKGKELFENVLEAAYHERKYFQLLVASTYGMPLL